MTEEAKGYVPTLTTFQESAQKSEIGQYAQGKGLSGFHYDARRYALPEARVAELEMALKAVRIITKHSPAYGSGDSRSAVEAIIAAALDGVPG